MNADFLLKIRGWILGHLKEGTSPSKFELEIYALLIQKELKLVDEPLYNEMVRGVINANRD